MDGLAEDEFCQFRLPKSVQEEDSLLVQYKPKSTRYKDKWAIEVFRTWQAAHKPKFSILDLGSMFKKYDGLQHVQNLKEKLKDLESLSLNYWLTKFVQEVANFSPTFLFYDPMIHNFRVWALDKCVQISSPVLKLANSSQHYFSRLASTGFSVYCENTCELHEMWA